MKHFKVQLLGAIAMLAAWMTPASAQNLAANAGPDQTVSVGATCQATVTLDGSASTGDSLTYSWTGGFIGGTATGVNPSVTFSAGAYTVTLTVTDSTGATATDTVNINANDTTPPSITGTTATPAVLWPPNHKMHHVKVAATVMDNCDSAPTCKIISVASSADVPATPQHGNGNGNGNGGGHGGGNPHNPPADYVITGDLTVDLRAERAGTETNGRTYTITIQCTDHAGNSSNSTVTVTVPHDQRGHHAVGTF